MEKKYLKYKKKYLSLKKQLGGMDDFIEVDSEEWKESRVQPRVQPQVQSRVHQEKRLVKRNPEEQEEYKQPHLLTFTDDMLSSIFSFLEPSDQLVLNKHVLRRDLNSMGHIQTRNFLRYFVPNTAYIMYVGTGVSDVFERNIIYFEQITLDYRSYVTFIRSFRQRVYEEPPWYSLDEPSVIEYNILRHNLTNDNPDILYYTGEDTNYFHNGIFLKPWIHKEKPIIYGQVRKAESNTCLRLLNGTVLWGTSNLVEFWQNKLASPNNFLANSAYSPLIFGHEYEFFEDDNGRYQRCGGLKRYSRCYLCNMTFVIEPHDMVRHSELQVQARELEIQEIEDEQKAIRDFLRS